MKVLRPPIQKRKPRYYYGKCSNSKCRGEFSFHEDEVYFPNDLIYYQFASCPNCKMQIQVLTKKIYAGIKS